MRDRTEANGNFSLESHTGLHFWHSFLTVPNSWHRAAFIFCLCTDPGTSPGGLESGVRQFISPRLNHWFFTISTAWFRRHVALEKEVPLGDSIARSWFHLAECCGSVLSSVATPQRVPGTRSRPHFASIRPPHSRCLAPDLDPCLLYARNRHTWCGPVKRLHRLATGGYGQGTGTRMLPNRSHRLPSGGQRREYSFHRLATGGYGRSPPAAATGATTLRLGRIKVLIYTWAAAGLPQTSEP